MSTKDVQQVLGKVSNGVCIIGAGYKEAKSLIYLDKDYFG